MRELILGLFIGIGIFVFIVGMEKVVRLLLF